MSDDLNTEIKIGADASGVEAGVGRAKRSLSDLGVAAKKAGKDAGDGVGSIGTGGDKAARDVERATKSMQGSLQRLLAEQKAGAKDSREYYEALADTRGISRSAIKPILDQIDAAKSKTLQAKTAADSWTASLGKVGPLVAAAFSGAAITGFLGKVVSVQREFDVLNSSLKTVTGSSAAAEREMAWLKDFAKETPFGLAQATQGFVKMKALGLDPTRAALTSFGNTASAMGKDLNQMIEAVADASTGEFERLKEFGIKAKKEGDNVSLTFQGVTTTIKNSASEITKYLEDIGNVQFGGAMAERAKTLDGAISELGDTWDELFRTINERNAGGTLIYDSIKLANGAIEDATTIIKAMTAAYDDSGRATGALTTFQEGVATVFETVAVLGANLKYVITQVGTEIGGLAAQVAQAAQFNFAGVAAIREQMVADAEEARKQIDLTEKRILGARKAQEEYARYATRNASAATDPRRIDLGASSAPAAATRAGTRATKEALSEYDKLMQRLGVDLPKAAAAAEAAQHGYNKAQEEFIALAGSAVWAGFTNQQRAQVAALFENRIASEQAADAAKTLAKANLDAAASREKYLVSLSTGLDKIKADTAAQLEATARLGLSKEAIAELDAAKLEMLATDLELQAIKAMDRNLDEQTYNALKQQAEAYRELAAAKKAGAAKEMELDLVKANQEAAKKAADEWQRAADDINRSLTDALLRGFESGKGFAENLRDTLKNMFSTLILRPIISAALSPVAGAVNGFVGNAVGGAAGSGIGSSIATSIGTSAIGSAFSMGLTNFGTGLGSTLANGVFGGIGTNISNFGTLAGAGNLSGALGVAAPYLAGIGALYAIISSLDDSGTYHTGGAAQYNAATGLTSGQSGANFDIGFGRVEAGAETISAVGSIAQGIGAALNSVATSFGQTAGYEIATAFADDTSKDGAWGALRISKDGKELLNWDNNRMSKWAPKEFADGEAGYKEYLAAVAKDTRQVLLDMDLPSWADSMLNAIGDSASMEDLQAVITQIGVVQTAFVGLGKSIEGFAGMTDKAFEAIMKASGGIDALSANASTYYQNFYSADERKAKAREQVQAQLADLGIKDINFDAPDAREQYRKLVDEALARANKQAISREALTTAFAGMDLQSVSAGSLSDVLRGFGGGTATPEALAGLATSLNELGQSAGGLDDIQQSITDYISANAQALGLEDDAAATAAALLGLSGSFAELTQSAEDTQAAMEAQAREAQSQALRNLQEAYNRERKRLEAQLDSIADTRAAYEQQQSIVQETYDTLAGVFDLLHESVLDLYGSVESTVQMQAEEAARFIAQSVSNAQLTGYLPEQDKLSEAIKAARAGIDSGTYANSTEQDFAKLVLAGQLKALEAVAEPQKTAAEQQLDLLKGQIDALDKQTEAINKQIKLQQEALDYWQEQIDIANGVYDATLSVADAIAALTKLMFPDAGKTPATGDSGGSAAFGGSPVNGGGSGGGRTPNSAGSSQYSRPVSLGTGGTVYSPVTDQAEVEKLNDLASIYHKYDGTGDLTGLLTDIKNAGGTIRDLEALSGYYQSDWERAAAAVGIPAFAVGTNYVPRDMLAQIHEGEAIVPKAFNPWAGGSMGSDNTALIAEIRSLREEVAGLRAAAESTAAATGDTADVLVRVTNNGNGMVTAAAPI